MQNNEQKIKELIGTNHNLLIKVKNLKQVVIFLKEQSLADEERIKFLRRKINTLEDSLWKLNADRD